MRALVYLFHCLPENAQRYRDALARLEIEHEVIPIVQNGFSSVYRELAAKERTSTYLDGLLTHHPPRRLDPGAADTAIVLASWSAGYGYTITLLGEESSAQAVDGVVFIDSCYSSIDRQTGKVRRAGLEPVRRYADRARQQDGTCVLWYGYADVPTCSELPSGHWQGYGSTQQTAEELVRWTGGPQYGFHTRFWDTRRGARGNHMAAMLEWGPGWLAYACEELQDRRRAAGIEAHPSRREVPPDIESIEEAELSPRRETLLLGSRGDLVVVWQHDLVEGGYDVAIDGAFGPETARATRSYQAERGLVADGIVGPLTWATIDAATGPSEPTTSIPALDTVGQMALQVALELQQSGLAEIPGPEAHPVILAMFAACERGGHHVALQSDEYAWCAACLSYCQLEAERRLGLTRADTGFIPRAAVWELHSDAVRRGVFHHADEVRRGEYVPQPGDHWIQVRAGYTVGPPAYPFAHSKGLGHTGRVISWKGEHGWTRDGNINDRITDVARSLDDPALIGFAEGSPRMLR